MILQDTIENTQIVYLYVNKFDYGTDLVNKEQNSGHPRSNTVYRAIFNTDTKSYRLIYKVDKDNVYSVFIPVLKVEEENDLEFVCDITVLTSNNILSFKISEKNLDDLLKWLKTDNSDIKEILGDVGGSSKKKKVKKATQQPAQVPSPVKADENGIIKLSPEILRFLNFGMELNKVDPLIFGTIFDLLIYLNQNVYSDTGVVSTNWLKLDREHGAGVNVSAAVEKLSRYLGQDRRTNLDEKDLMGALKDLLIEKSRRNYHEIQ